MVRVPKVLPAHERGKQSRRTGQAGPALAPMPVPCAAARSLQRLRAPSPHLPLLLPVHLQPTRPRAPRSAAAPKTVLPPPSNHTRAHTAARNRHAATFAATQPRTQPRCRVLPPLLSAERGDCHSSRSLSRPCQMLPAFPSSAPYPWRC